MAESSEYSLLWQRAYPSRLNCCAQTLIFRHDSSTPTVRNSTTRKISPGKEGKTGIQHTCIEYGATSSTAPAAIPILTLPSPIAFVRPSIPPLRHTENNQRDQQLFFSAIICPLIVQDRMYRARHHTHSAHALANRQEVTKKVENVK